MKVRQWSKKAALIFVKPAVYCALRSRQGRESLGTSTDAMCEPLPLCTSESIAEGAVETADSKTKKEDGKALSGEYSREQIEKMQKDAERRVMEMQRRSKGAIEKEGTAFSRPQSSGGSSANPSGSRFSGGQNYGNYPSDRSSSDSRNSGNRTFDNHSSDNRSFDKQGHGRDHSDARPSKKNPDGSFPPRLSEKPRLLELLNTNKMLNDPDDRLVLLLIAILSGEKADPILLLSLLYIIL